MHGRIETRRAEKFSLRRSRRTTDGAVADLMAVQQLGDAAQITIAVARMQRLGMLLNDEELIVGKTERH